MTDKRDLTADIIKVCAVITAMPRWVGALLAAEGILIPEDWRGWWVIASATFNAAMAVTEGLAFAYVFNAWRNQKDKAADKLFWLAIASGLTFVVVLAPFIAAQVRAATLNSILTADWALWGWSASVAASTIIIVASVGYAQKRAVAEPASRKPAKSEAESVTQPAVAESSRFTCQHCPAEFGSQSALNAHQRVHNGRGATLEQAGAIHRNGDGQ